MTHTLTATIDCGLSAALKGDTLIADAPSYNLTKASPIQLADGTGADQVKALYVAELSIAGSGNTTLDLTALTGPVSDAITFAKIRAIQFEADAANASTVTVGAAGSNAFVGPLGGTTPTFSLHAQDRALWSNRNTGWTVDGTHKNLKITNDDAATSKIRVTILGTT